MWNLSEHGLIARLPHQRFDRATSNGKPEIAHLESNADKQSPQSAWDEKFAKLDVYAAYEDDWDGQGTAALSEALSESAIQLAHSLRSAGIAPPSWIVPGVNGTISFEWRLDCGNSIEIEVTGPETAEIFLVSPGLPVERLEIINQIVVA